MYGIAVFVGAFEEEPIKDNGCQKFELRGAEDITPVGPTTAVIGSDDRENWLIHKNINQDDVENGKLSLLSNLDATEDKYLHTDDGIKFTDLL